MCFPHLFVTCSELQHHRNRSMMEMSRLQVLAVVGFAVCTACSAFECGAPFALCGESVPKDAKCPKGNGWCQAGHYCGLDKGQSKCLPMPKDCGKAGNVCCPSNTDTPHNASTNGRRPFCRDGSTCFFHWRDDELFNTPAYAGVTGRHFGLKGAIFLLCWQCLVLDVLASSCLAHTVWAASNCSMADHLTVMP
jgi:hypothetical protein